MNKNILSILVTVSFLASCAGGSDKIAATKPTDRTMNCQEVNQELAEMDKIIEENTLSTARGVGEGVAAAGAGYAGAFAGVPLLGQVPSLVSGSNQDSMRRMKEQAEERRSVLTGIAAGKNC